MEGGQLLLFLYVAAFIAIYYFLIIRPQQRRTKERRALIESLKVNDEVITAGGLHGKIKDIKEDVVILQIADNVRVKVDREAIGDRITKPSAE